MESNERQVKTRVIILHSSDDLYGADRILLQVAMGMQRAGFDPLVVLPDDIASRGLLYSELTSRGIEAYHLPIAVMRRRYLSPVGLLALALRLVRGTLAIRRLLKFSAGPVVLYGFTFTVLGAPFAATVLRLPLLAHCHEILERPTILRKIMHVIHVRRARKVLCVSHAVRQNILADEPNRATRVEVVYNGLMEDPAGAGDRRWARAELGIADELPVIGMIGRVCTWKGQDVFLKAASILKQRGRKFHAIAIGGVFDNERIHMDRLLQLRAELQMNGRFQIVDFRKDARTLMAAFDVLICPSTRPDPFPTVVLEAMEKSIPVVASAHGGPTEMLVDGVTGLLFEPNNALALADAMEALLMDPERGTQMGKRGRQRLLKTFTLDAQITAINEIVRAIAGCDAETYKYAAS